MNKLGIASCTCWLLVIAGTGQADRVAAAGPESGQVPSVPKRISVALMPLWSEGPVGKELGFGIIDRAGAELMGTGEYNHLHLKQVLRLAVAHGWRLELLSEAGPARKATALLGAQAGLYGSLRSDPQGGFVLQLAAFDLRREQERNARVKLPADPAEAVRQGARAAAGLVAALHGVSLPDEAKVQPDSASGRAMAAYLACAAVLLEQPMGLRESHVVDPQRLVGARRQCERAVEADPSLTAAWAALSLAESLAMRSQEAARALEPVRKAAGYLPIGTLAHYWLATRFQSNADGARVLQDALGAHPGSLVFLAYLGEHLQITRQYAQAAATWERALQLAPDNPFFLARRGHALARLGRIEEAIALSRKACQLDPDRLDLQLELASRLVDAGQLDQAEQLLVPMAADPRAHGEVLLRLGYVYLLQKRDDQAEAWLERTLAKAIGPNEWRTRGRTRYDLAILMARRGKLAEAERHLLAAAEEGFLVRELLQADPDLKVLEGRPACAHLFKSPKLKIDLALRATPFPVDLAGEADPDAKRKRITGFTF